MTDSSSCFDNCEDLACDELSDVCKEFSDICKEFSDPDNLIFRNYTLPHIQISVSSLQNGKNCTEDSSSSPESLTSLVNVSKEEAFSSGSSKGQEDHWQKMIKDIKEGSVACTTISLCGLHEINQDHFCIDCNVVTCTECITEVHATHDCVEVAIALEDRSSQLKKCLQPAFQCMLKTEASLHQLTQDKEAIESNRIFCKETVQKLINKVRATVDEKEQQLLAALDRYVDRKLNQVEHQEKNVNEVRNQVNGCIKEIHGVLQGTSLDLSLIIDKNEFVEEINLLAQNMTDIEACLHKTMFSSTYAGFHDHSNTFQEKLDEIVVMCEYYPDSDSGYYTSRVLSLDSEEEDDDDVPSLDSCYQVHSPHHRNWSHSLVEDGYISSQAASSPLSVGLKRSHSTPSGMTRPMRLVKRRTTDATESLTGPLIPIRYDSLRVAATAKAPLKVFDKLSSLKMDIVYPCGVCMGENNSFIITDVRNHCLRIISSSGKCIGDIGKEGKGLGQFEDPSAVAVNEKMQLLVCQRENARIQKLTSSGKYVKKFGQKTLRGTCLGEPWGLVAAPDGKLYVTDWDKNCIHVFNSSGDSHSSLGGDDSLLGESLKLPAGIDMNSEGQLIVADRSNHCLWLLATNGHILRRIGSQGHGAGELYYPYGVAVHQNGSIIVSESGNNRISVFSSCGKFLKCFGKKGEEPGMFLYPRHLCITPKGQLVVADELNHRLQLFDL